MKLYIFNSLKFKISSIIFFMVIIVFSLVIWKTLDDSYEKSRQEIYLVKETTLKLLNLSSRTALFAEEYDAIQFRIESIASDPQIENIYLADNRGIVVASNQFGQLGRTMPDIKINENKPVRVKKITNVTGDMGKLYVQYSFSSQPGVDKTIFINALVLGLFGTFLIAGISLLFGFLLTRRLSVLTRSAINLSKGNYHIRTNLSGKDEVSLLGDSFDKMAEYIELEQQKLHDLNIDLEKKVLERTRDYEIANKELESFCHAVSHDLRSPLRSIDGFSQALVEDYSDHLDDMGKDYINRIRNNVDNMSELIGSLLNLSMVTQSVIKKEKINLSEICSVILDQLQERSDARQVEIKIEENINVIADKNLMLVVLENLLNNSWKYTRELSSETIIEFGCAVENGKSVYFVKDNGAGFDMKYSDKLFDVFKRLHSSAEFEGTGVGLSTVKRIINRHGGNIWAQAEVNRGCCFFFTLDNRLE